MGWNNDYTLLTGPISAADLGRAAGYPSGKDGDNIFDVGWLIKNGLFNPMAKHKAFKSSAPGYAYDKNQSTPETRSPSRVAALLAARCGFGSIPVISPTTFQTAPARWVYQQPSAGSPTEFFRVMDFDGYNTMASAPFLLVMNEQYAAGQPIRVQLLTNHRVDDEAGYNFEWEYNVTLEELLMDLRQNNEYIHLFIKKTSGTGAGTLNIVILTNDADGYAMPLTALAPNSTPRGLGVEGQFLLYPNGSGNDPAIPVLQNAVSGDTFDVCAAFGTIPDGVVSGHYRVYTSVPSMTWYSLNLNGQNSRRSFAMTQLVNNISGTIQDIVLEATSDYFTDPYGRYFHKYIIRSVRARVTTGQLYTGEAVNMTFRISFDGSEGTMYGFIGVIQNNEIVERNNFSTTFQFYSNQQNVLKYFCDESTGFTDRFFWALDDGDPDDTYQMGVSCVVERISYPNVALNSGSSNIVHF